MNLKHPMRLVWFSLGFLGMLHGDRQGGLEREYDLDLITSAPTVIYELNLVMDL